MNKNTLFTSLFLFILLVGTVCGSASVLEVTVIEYASSLSSYDQTQGQDAEGAVYIADAFGEPGENHTGNSRTGISLDTLSVYGRINITNNETVGGSIVNSINLTLVDTNNVTALYLDTVSPVPAYLQFNISPNEAPVNEDNLSIYISELRPGDSVVFNFSIATAGIPDPLNFTSAYDSWRMLTGSTMGANLNVTNSFPTNVLISDLTLTSEPGCYASTNVGGESCFNFSTLGGGDSANARIKDVGGKNVIYWNASSAGVGTSGTLTQGESAELTFDVTAPTNLTHNWDAAEDWATWLNMGNWSASFTFNGSMSGLNIYDVSGVVTDSFVEVSKRRVNETHWNASVKLTNDAATTIDYNVSQVTIWATKYQNFNNPGDSTNWVEDAELVATGGISVASTTANATWNPNLLLAQGASNTDYSIRFNYSRVPIVWATADITIYEDGSQIMELGQTESQPDGYMMYEEVYVLVGGYLIKSTKTVDPIVVGTTDNAYAVNITLENVGAQRTPEWITMFDLLPSGFTPLIYATDAVAGSRAMTTNAALMISNSAGAMTALAAAPDTVLGSTDAGAIVGGVYDGYWGYNLDFTGLDATSNGDGLYDAGSSSAEILVSYKMTGDNFSHVENAYIVGIDPIRLEGANPSKNIASALNMVESVNLEFVVLFVSLILSIILLSAGLIVREK